MSDRGARTQREARARFRATLQDASLTVSDGVVLDVGDQFAFVGGSVPLGRDRAYALSVRHFFATLPISEGSPGWDLRTVGYSYRLRHREGQELLVFQWHPTGQSPVTWPHLHLGSRLLRPELARPFASAHLPTGQVTLAAVLCVAIADLGVEPLRDDWAARLAEADGVLAASLG